MKYDTYLDRLRHIRSYLENSKHAGHPIYRLGLNSIDPDITLPEATHLTDDVLKKYAVNLVNKSILDKYNQTIEVLFDEMVDDIVSYRKRLLDVKESVGDRNFELFPTQETVTFLSRLDDDTIKRLLSRLTDILTSIYHVPEYAALDEVHAMAYNSMSNLNSSLPQIVSTFDMIVSSMMETIDGMDMIDLLRDTLFDAEQKIETVVKNELVDDRREAVYWFYRVYREYRHGFRQADTQMVPVMVRIDRTFDEDRMVDIEDGVKTFRSLVSMFRLPDDRIDPEYLPIDPISSIESIRRVSESYTALLGRLKDLFMGMDLSTDSDTFDYCIRRLVMISESIKLLMDVTGRSVDHQLSIRNIIVVSDKIVQS